MEIYWSESSSLKIDGVGIACLSHVPMITSSQ